MLGASGTGCQTVQSPRNAAVARVAHRRQSLDGHQPLAGCPTQTVKGIAVSWKKPGPCWVWSSKEMVRQSLQSALQDHAQQKSGPEVSLLSLALTGPAAPLWVMVWYEAAAIVHQPSLALQGETWGLSTERHSCSLGRGRCDNLPTTSEGAGLVFVLILGTKSHAGIGTLGGITQGQDAK